MFRSIIQRVGNSITATKIITVRQILKSRMSEFTNPQSTIVATTRLTQHVNYLFVPSRKVSSDTRVPLTNDNSTSFSSKSNSNDSSNITTMPQQTQRPLKILMLHGYTQSGPLFNAKTKVLTKTLAKLFPSVTFEFPTGPLVLDPADVPGFDPSSLDSSTASSTEYHAWWRRSNTSSPPEYIGLEDGLAHVASTLREKGPFDGVMGFSQGGALAGMVTSLLEPDRRASFQRACSEKDGLSIAFPESFLKLNESGSEDEGEEMIHPQFRFCIVYSGFMAPGARYQAFYRDPTITTPTLHVVGSLDSVVEESRTTDLVNACGGSDSETARVLVHPGGHFVPSGKAFVEAVAGFIRECLEGGDSDGSGKEKKEEEESVEDMDVPF